MAQKLDVQIVIPSEYVLIRKDRYEKLEDAELKGQWWGLKELMERVSSKDPKWVRENILERYQELLDIDGQGLRIAFYPAKGQKWKFNAAGMKKFLDAYFPEIMESEYKK